MYDDQSLFKARVLEEIKRARRYPTFVSMIQFDISHINSIEEIENFENLIQFQKNLMGLVGRSVRDTDLVSHLDHGKIAILLVETAREGAYSVRDRLKKTIKYFLCNNTKSPINWRVPSKEHFFPGARGNTSDLQAAIEDLNN